MPDLPTAALMARWREAVAALETNWDFDESMDPDLALELPHARLVTALYEHDHGAAARLALFCARRTAACWSTIVGDSTLTKRCEDLAAAVFGDAQPDWDTLSTPVSSPFSDCRFCATSCSATAVALAAQLVRAPSARIAVLSVSDADCAASECPGEGDFFREWMLEIAVPASLRGSDLTPTERQAFLAGSTLRPSLSAEGLRSGPRNGGEAP